MNFLEYQQQAALTSGAGRQPLTAEQTRLAIAALGLAGEAGELLDVLKGTSWSQAADNKGLFMKEAGDSCWYVAEIATCLGLNKQLNSQVEFVGQGAQMWPRSLTACGGDVCVEAAAVAEMVKKHLGHGHLLGRAEIAVRLNRVLAYIGQLALVFGVTMEEIAEGNLEKLAARYAGGFSPEASINRAA